MLEKSNVAEPDVFAKKHLSEARLALSDKAQVVIFDTQNESKKPRVSFFQLTGQCQSLSNENS
ncbi:MAG: hypothetical protein PHI06_11605 [Desulfobulbaceae bacterium]|nr:hypothetical protein [Desulfobulbaceae bacterium]